ncbi:MAG: hypothetical protein KDK27_12650, partial [Leptospiraceae bacterium]|nr:hypothetical protein [Leptospiraceae bacterium]
GMIYRMAQFGIRHYTLIIENNSRSARICIKNTSVEARFGRGAIACAGFLWSCAAELELLV